MLVIDDDAVSIVPRKFLPASKFRILQILARMKKMDDLDETIRRLSVQKDQFTGVKKYNADTTEMAILRYSKLVCGDESHRRARSSR